MRRVLVLLVFVVLVAGCARRPAAVLEDGSPANVLLISVDSLRVDRLRAFGAAEGAATPHLEGLVRSGTSFTNAWATAPWTAPAMVSVFTGLYPPSHGVAVRDDTTPPGLPTLATVLGDRGYRHGNFSFFSGISYFAGLGLPPPPEGLFHRTLVEVFDRWVEGPEPFFAWLHLLEPHLPYGATGYRAREVTVPGSSGLERAQLRSDVPVGSVEFAPGDRERLLRLYDDDVAAFDRTLGEVLATLDRRGLRERTVLVLVADHGEELLEHGWIGHASTSRDARLVPEILRVPLVLAGPGVPPGVVSDALVQQVDLLPTLADLLGLELATPVDGLALELSLRGVSSRRDAAFFESSVGGNLTPEDRESERLRGVTDGHCWVRWTTGGPGEGLPTADAGGGCPPERVRRLADRAAVWERRQAARRLELMASAGDGRPDPADVESWPGDLEVLRPAAGAVLRHDEAGGIFELAWLAPEEGSYWVEYRAGPAGAVTGAFPAGRPEVRIGPFPEGFWNDVAAYSPIALRVLDAGTRRRSPWLEIRVAPAS